MKGVNIVGVVWGEGGGGGGGGDGPRRRISNAGKDSKFIFMTKYYHCQKFTGFVQSSPSRKQNMMFSAGLYVNHRLSDLHVYSSKILPQDRRCGSVLCKLYDKN